MPVHHEIPTICTLPIFYAVAIHFCGKMFEEKTFQSMEKKCVEFPLLWSTKQTLSPMHMNVVRTKVPIRMKTNIFGLNANGIHTKNRMNDWICTIELVMLWWGCYQTNSSLVIHSSKFNQFAFQCYMNWGSANGQLRSREWEGEREKRYGLKGMDNLYVVCER